MLLKQNTNITIKNSPEKIWDYAHDPVNWTASNPEEHLGLVFNSRDNRPHTEVTFHQKETVANFYADLKGQIMYADRPKVLVWTGVAVYPILFFKIRIPEGGLLTLEEKEDGTHLNHNVFMDFPDSVFGKVIHWFFVSVFKGEKAVYNHTYKELKFFKEQLEK